MRKYKLCFAIQNGLTSDPCGFALLTIGLDQWELSKRTEQQRTVLPTA